MLEYKCSTLNTITAQSKISDPESTHATKKRENSGGRNMPTQHCKKDRPGKELQRLSLASNNIHGDIQC